jgi:hypothetical protein
MGTLSRTSKWLWTDVTDNLFRSWFQAGFECSTQRLRSGRRLDMIHASEHDRWLKRDYERLREREILTAREGLRWHLIRDEKGVHDFSSALPTIRAAREAGIQIIWDLVHFGWPDHLDVFTQEWVDALAELAREFAAILRQESCEVPLIAPCNEISFLSWAGADVACINPYAVGRGHELKRQLVRGAIAASEVVLRELPNVKLISPEPVIHIAGDPAKPNDTEEAAAYRMSMFEAWDMILGRVHQDLGGREEYIAAFGLNYYDRNQWWNHGRTIHRDEPEYRPFRRILQEVYERYRRPVFVSETGAEDDDRAAWFAYIADEADAATTAGVPVEGICLYPILNHPGWEDDRHCHNGFWDYADAFGNREIHEPLAEELHRRQQKKKGNQNYDAHYTAPART